MRTPEEIKRDISDGKNVRERVSLCIMGVRLSVYVEMIDGHLYLSPGYGKSIYYIYNSQYVSCPETSVSFLLLMMEMLLPPEQLRRFIEVNAHELELLTDDDTIYTGMIYTGLMGMMVVIPYWESDCVFYRLSRYDPLVLTVQPNEIALPRIIWKSIGELRSDYAPIYTDDILPHIERNGKRWKTDISISCISL